MERFDKGVEIFDRLTGRFFFNIYLVVAIRSFIPFIIRLQWERWEYIIVFTVFKGDVFKYFVTNAGDIFFQIEYGH